MAALLKEYDTVLDTKHRITLRSGPKRYKNYHVRVYDDGRISMEPRVLVAPEYVSERTLRMMDCAMNNLAEGTRSVSLDTREMKKAADELPD